MALVRVVPNVEAVVAALPEVQDHLNERAERVLSTARASAPVDTGAYRAGLHVEAGEDGAVLVAGGTDHDIYVEADTGNLNRALDAAR